MGRPRSARRRVWHCLVGATRTGCLTAHRGPSCREHRAALAAVILAAASVWLAMSAITELGRQWSLAARLTEDHKLVKTGVYAIVRHPIYTAMLGLMIATGLVLSNWIGLAAAIVIFFIGTRIRTHLEEELLREAFGEEFIVWKERVPSLLPFVNI